MGILNDPHEFYEVYEYFDIFRWLSKYVPSVLYIYTCLGIHYTQDLKCFLVYKKCLQGVSLSLSFSFSGERVLICTALNYRIAQIQ